MCNLGGFQAGDYNAEHGANELAERSTICASRLLPCYTGARIVLCVNDARNPWRDDVAKSESTQVRKAGDKVAKDTSKVKLGEATPIKWPSK